VGAVAAGHDNFRQRSCLIEPSARQRFDELGQLLQGLPGARMSEVRYAI
jgi:hypothetical protein